jgi:transcriptional regulator with GAF, ATPase, and Fis domain
MGSHAPTIARQRWHITDLEQRIAHFKATGQKTKLLEEALAHVRRCLDEALSQQSSEQAARTERKARMREEKRVARLAQREAPQTFYLVEPTGTSWDARIGQAKVRALREALERAGGNVLAAARLLQTTEARVRYAIDEFSGPAPSIDDLLS